VYFLDEVCGFLRVSRRTAERLRRYGAFPIPELRALDKRPRFSGADILRYLEGQSSVRHARSVRLVSR
jgi:predicted site-specific integrase-resolvase